MPRRAKMRARMSPVEAMPCPFSPPMATAKSTLLISLLLVLPWDALAEQSGRDSQTSRAVAHIRHVHAFASADYKRQALYWQAAFLRSGLWQLIYRAARRPGGIFRLPPLVAW